MIVKIASDGVTIVDADDLKRLKVTTHLEDGETIERILDEQRLGRLSETKPPSRPTEALLDIGELKQRAGAVASASDWLMSWTAMINGAEKAGWTVDDGASVRAHIEYLQEAK